MTYDPKQDRKNQEEAQASPEAQARQAEQVRQAAHTGQDRRTEQGVPQEGVPRQRNTAGEQRDGEGVQERSGRAAGTAEPAAGPGQRPAAREAVRPLHAKGPHEQGEPAGQDQAPGAVAGKASGGRPAGKVPGQQNREVTARLFPQDESDKLTQRLQEALNTFVDSPRRSVEEAADVLEQAAERLTNSLGERHRSLRAGWEGTSEGDRSRSTGSTDGGSPGGTDTEDLRIALQTYREVTERLLRI